MAKRVRDATMDSRAARERLKIRGKPYYRLVERGLHLGYRRLKRKAGTWVARHYVGEQEYQVESLGTADDFGDADGIKVLTFDQAVAAARERMQVRTKTGDGKSRAPVTVAAAMDDYIEFLEHNRKSARDARYHDTAFIRPKLGDTEVSALTADDIRKWLNVLAKAAPRLRTKPGEKQQHREAGTDNEAKRRRKASANRVLTTLKAALNRAFREGDAASDAEWRRVEPFENVDAARIRYLTVAEAQRLVNACEPDFRRLVQGALQTGCRYGELCALTVGDFNADSGTLAIRTSKTGKPRHVVLTGEGAAFFRQICIGRAGSELMFIRSNGEAWNKSSQHRPIKTAMKAANITPHADFHALRHTWASLAVMNGVPLLVVAKNLGHSDTRMVERHYGHLAPSYVADAIRAGAPQFGFQADAKVVELA